SMSANGSQSPSVLNHNQEIPVETDWVFGLKVALALIMGCFFVYMDCVMLYTFYKKDAFQENSCYILFAHMLFNDGIHLFTCVLLYILAICYLYIPKALCAAIVVTSSSTFNMPLILATMALECYLAICLPLRHIEICTARRTTGVLWVIWFLGSFSCLVDLFATLVVDFLAFFRTKVFCTREVLIRTMWQADMRLYLSLVYFVSVGAVIFYTYIRIMLQAHSVAVNKASASKARRTVLLHTFQLMLCMAAFVYPVTEALLQAIDTAFFIHIRYLNFLVLVILPRCLSSVIYGLRDQAFKHAFKNYFTCATKKVHPFIELH
uniref:G-protein coupled receptors family 1 profile domain-containing protein n=1 Tax=Latimeria chalumnae TaxID=7897 RepID=H2ZTN1_LATCH